MTLAPASEEGAAFVESPVGATPGLLLLLLAAPAVALTSCELLGAAGSGCWAASNGGLATFDGCWAAFNGCWGGFDGAASVVLPLLSGFEGVV